MLINKLREFKKILILGYGVEGKSTHAFLKKYHPTAQVAVADERDGLDYLANQHEFDLAIKTPSISPSSVQIPYTTQTNLFFANTKQKKIGITGSKGKSSTATLLYNVLTAGGFSTKLFGNIGYPMLDYFLGDMHESDVLVLELSSYQLADIEYSPHIACFLNIYNDHIAQHGSYKAYFDAKANIAKFCSQEDYFIYNGAFAEIEQLAKATHALRIDFSKSDIRSLRHQSLSTDSLKAVYEITRLMGVSVNTYSQCVHDFSGLPHRLQVIGEFHGITFINDSSATTPEAAIFAINQIHDISTILLGGLDRQLQTEDLVKAAVNKHIKHFILFPEVHYKLQQQLKQAGMPDSSIFLVQDMQEAVTLCYKLSHAGDVCLLSPGFASYNQYINFPARGEDFRRLVHQMALE